MLFLRDLWPLRRGAKHESAAQSWLTQVHITKLGIQVLQWDGEAVRDVERKTPTALRVLRAWLPA